ncbi:hypothetical protein L2E82_17497 [Cichorium intybus]|uniref:Uncharacterized protein n=1 Tax=Cichorium intybus TaxID=13427 RepID=A0ACB9F914_CICIN|nr:hypothetical protein L2E82_17497 [Cichorium intybus]
MVIELGNQTLSRQEDKRFPSGKFHYSWERNGPQASRSAFLVFGLFRAICCSLCALTFSCTFSISFPPASIEKSHSDDDLDGISDTIDYDEDERHEGWDVDGVTKEEDTRNETVKRNKITQELNLDGLNREEQGDELHDGEKRNLGEGNSFTEEGEGNDAMKNDRSKDEDTQVEESVSIANNGV